MVLQRNKPIVLSGRCAPGAALEVALAEEKQPAAGDATGHWSAAFSPRSAGGPYAATLSDGAHTIVLEDILIGDVWFCSGQSNMEFPVGGERPCFHLPEAEEVLAQADCPQLRLCNCCRRLSETPQEEVAPFIAWQPCSARSLRDFSAVAYFFGRKMLRDQQVPVGLIHCSWGGAGIEPWISSEKFAQAGYDLHLPDEAEWRREWHEKIAASPELMQWLDAFEAAMPAIDPAWLQDDFDDSRWLPEHQGATSFPAPGRMVTRIHFNVPDDFAGKALTLTFGPVMDLDYTYLNGQPIGQTRQDGYQGFISMRHYKVPAGALKAGKNLLTTIVDGHGGGTVEVMPITLSADDGTATQLDDFFCRSCLVGRRPDDFPPKPALPRPANSGQYMPFTIRRPATMFNGMAAPWRRLALCGILWYQGCSDAGTLSYYQLNQMLIDDWREQWHDPELPFLLVQLAAYYQNTPAQPHTQAETDAVDAIPHGEVTGYSLLREIQAEMPRIRRNVGMVTAFDAGEAFNIHPYDKRTVGERLALKAQSMLGMTGALADGPEFDGMRFEGSRIRLFFRNCGTGLVTKDGQPPRNFWLAAGGDIGGTTPSESRFWPAQARIEGNTVVVWNDNVAYPQRVHYAFTGFCHVNLYNREGLPALPFRTDKIDYQAMLR